MSNEYAQNIHDDVIKSNRFTGPLWVVVAYTKMFLCFFIMVLIYAVANLDTEITTLM